MSLEIRRVEVADKDRLGSVARVLVHSCSANAEGRVDAGHNDDFALDSATEPCQYTSVDGVQLRRRRLLTVL